MGGKSVFSSNGNGQLIPDHKKTDYQVDKHIPFPNLSLGAASVVVFLAAILCFANSYDGQFVFDDSEAIEGNKDLLPSTPVTDLLIHDFWGRKLSNVSHKSYRPLTVLTFRWSYWLADGLHPKGFHIANLVLHGVVCTLSLLVFDLVLAGSHSWSDWGSFSAPRLSVLCSMLFAVHPVHTESVSAVVGRADLLCALFFLLSLLAYIKGSTCYSLVCPDKFSLPWLLLSMVFCALATFSKEQGITAIGACSAFDILSICQIDLGDILGLRSNTPSSPSSNGHTGDTSGCAANKNRRSPTTSWKLSLLKRQTLLTVSAIFLLVVRWRVMGSAPPTFQVHDNPHSFVNSSFFRGLNYSYLYSINVWLLLAPQWLCFDWSMGCVPTITSIGDVRLLGAVALLASLFLLAWVCLCNSRETDRRSLTLAVVLMVVPFLPASNLLFRVGFVVAERVLYLPSVGFCVLVVLGLGRLCERAWLRHKVIAGFLILLTIFMIRSVQRSNEWRVDMDLFTSGERVCPLNAKVHYNIGKLSGDRGNMEAAIAKYRHAIHLNSQYDQAMNNLANILKDRGQEEEAEGLLDRAVSITPEFAAAWMNRGIVKASLKKYAESERSYREGIRHRKIYPDCYYNLGNLYLEMNRSQEALDAFYNATRLKPTHWNSWNNAVILLDNLQLYDQAANMALAALKAIPGNPSLMYSLAGVYGKQGNYEEGEKWFLAALKLDPNSASGHLNLGVLYHRWGQLTKAEHHYQTSLQLNPNNPVTISNLDMLRAKMKS